MGYGRLSQKRVKPPSDFRIILSTIRGKLCQPPLVNPFQSKTHQHSRRWGVSEICRPYPSAAPVSFQACQNLLSRERRRFNTHPRIYDKWSWQRSVFLTIRVRLCDSFSPHFKCRRTVSYCHPLTLTLDLILQRYTLSPVEDIAFARKGFLNPPEFDRYHSKTIRGLSQGLL
jgi:hypothetical protein